MVTELRNGRLVTAQVDGTYWMYRGKGVIYAATSDDPIRWTPGQTDTAPDRYLTWEAGSAPGTGGWKLDRIAGPLGLRPIASPRRRRFDSLLTEPGPPAVLTEAGITLIYNGANHWVGGDEHTPPMAYQPGQILFDSADPTAVIARTQSPFLRIDPAEAHGQVGNVCFAQGLMAFQGLWFLYLGLADSRLGVSTAPIHPGDKHEPGAP